MAERQEGEKQLPLADERESGCAGEALRQEIERREGESFLGACAPGGEEDGRGVVGTEGGEGSKNAVDLVSAAPSDLLAENGRVSALQACGRVEENGPEGSRKTGRGRLHLRELLLRVDDDEGRAEPCENRRQLGFGQVRGERRDEDSVNEAGEIAAGGLEAVFRDDRDPRRGARKTRERRRDASQAPRGLGIGPPRRLGTGRALEEDPLGMGGDALGEERREGISRGADRAERRLGPARPRRGVGEGQKEFAAARLIQIPMPRRGRDRAVREGALRGGDERQSRFGGDRRRAVQGSQSVEAVRDRVRSLEQRGFGALHGIPPPAPPQPDRHAGP